MTDLDELKALWAEHDRKLDASLRLNRRLLTESRLARARTALGSVRRLVGFELVANVVALVALVAFAIANPALRFAAPALLLAAGELALVHGSVRQLAAARIDPGEPIAVAQRWIAELRRLRVTYVRWTLLLAAPAWPPFAIVALKLLFDVDAWGALGVAWLAANLAFGLAVLAIAWWLSMRVRARRSPWVARLADALSGRSVAEAARALDEIAAFERELDPAGDRS